VEQHQKLQQLFQEKSTNMMEPFTMLMDPDLSQILSSPIHQVHQF
jgi:hypothetical protein